MNNFDTIKANGKTFKLNVGELVRFETDITHYYFLDGEYLPGVSSILQEAAPTPYGLKLFWQNNTKQDADSILQETGDFGSKMHDAFERLLLGQEINLLKDYPTEKEKKCLMAFRDWFTTFNPSEFMSEQPIASSKYKYAGTLDFVGTINGEKWLIDFKTTNAIHMSHQLQVLAYCNAYEESYGLKIDRMGVVRCGTTHKGTTNSVKAGIKTIGKGWEFKEVTEYKMDDFMNIYKTYLTLHGGSIPTPPELEIYPETLKLLEEVK